MFEVLKRIEDLREELHDAMDKGNGDDILHKSRALDAEILNFINLLKRKKEEQYGKLQISRGVYGGIP